MGPSVLPLLLLSFSIFLLLHTPIHGAQKVSKLSFLTSIMVPNCLLGNNKIFMSMPESKLFKFQRIFLYRYSAGYSVDFDQCYLNGVNYVFWCSLI